MEYINRPSETEQNVVHETFFCRLYDHELEKII